LHFSFSYHIIEYVIIKQLTLSLTAAEIAQRLRALLARVEQIKDPVVQLADGRIALNGTFQAGLSISFGMTWTADVRPNNRVALRLASFNAGLFGGSAMGGKVLEMLAAKLGAQAGLTVEGDCLVLALEPFLAQYGIELAGTVRNLSITTAGAELIVA
jgi:hypothetical protein